MPSMEDYANNTFALGALMSSLHGDGIEARPIYDGDRITSIRVHFPILRSDYRVTVERIPGTEVPDGPS